MRHITISQICPHKFSSVWLLKLQMSRWCCSVLQCSEVCCSVLQCVAVRCSVLQCVANVSLVLPLSLPDITYIYTHACDSFWFLRFTLTYVTHYDFSDFHSHMWLILIAQTTKVSRVLPSSLPDITEIYTHICDALHYLKFTLKYVTHYDHNESHIWVQIWEIAMRHICESNFSNLHSDMWLITILHVLGCLLQKSP